MKVWIDVFSGDEMISDSYKQNVIMNGACLEVQAKYITKGNEKVDVGGGNAFGGGEESDGEAEGETVINVVDAHKLQETQLSKKDFMTMVKAYLKRVVAHLKEKGKEDRVADFQKGATEMIKFIVGKYDEMMIFTGESYDCEAGLAFSYTKDGETEPVFLFFIDGMREEKF